MLLQGPSGRRLAGWALVVAAFGSRAAVRAHDFTTFDAGLYAMGVRDYDIVAGQPHPPGYPLLILAAQVIDLVVGDPAQSLPWLSVVCAALTVLLLVRFGEEFVGPWVGHLAAVLFLLSPVAFFNGAVGLSYSAEGALSVACAWMAWRAGRHATSANLLALGLFLAVAVGVRPSSMFFLGPLGLWPILQAGPLRDRLRRTATVAIAGGAGVAVWLFPMLRFGGGPRAVLQANSLQSRLVVFSDTVFTEGWRVVPEHARHLAHYAHAELAALPWIAAAVAVGWLAGGRRAWNALRSGAGARVPFLILWLLPSVLFYLLLYVGWPIYPSGYLMVILPGLCITAAALLMVPWRHAAPGQAWVRALALACAVLLLVPLAAAPSALQAASGPIRAADAWAGDWRDIDDVCPVDTCAIAAFGAWFHIKLREPEHLGWVLILYDHEEDDARHAGIETRHGHDDPRYYDLVATDPADVEVHAIPDWVQRILVYDGHPAVDGEEVIIKRSVPLQDATLPSGRVVHWFEPQPQWRTIEAHFDGIDAAWAEARLNEQESEAAAT